MSPTANTKTIFITGGTGYIGSRLISILLTKGHRVISLVRKGSEQKVPSGAEVVVADPFDANSFSRFIPAGSVVVQLLGVAHPSPRKAEQFRSIDLRSVRSTADAAAVAGAGHLIYVSVAMSPSKMMRAYQEVRSEGERYCSSKQIHCTFIRPWYVLGPGHWWPVILLPFYGLAELIPSWRKPARSKALVTIRQMLRTLVTAIEMDPKPATIFEIRDIRRANTIIPVHKETSRQEPSYL